MGSKKEGYPDDNPKTVEGLKKPSIFVIPPAGLLHCGRAMQDGRDKYGLMNWRERAVSTSVYLDASYRHLMAFADGENFSRDTVAKGRPVHHLGHVMACCAIVLDAMAIGKLVDDRPLPGAAADLIEQWTLGTKPK